MAKRGDKKKRMIGQVARSGSHTVRSYQVGAVPILRSILDRMALTDKFRQHLSKETSRMRVPTAETLQVLVANILVARQPIYGVGEWATTANMRHIDKVGGRFITILPRTREVG